MGFLKARGRRYDPKNIMSKLRVGNNVGTYEHEADPVLEEMSNLDTLEEVHKVL